MPVQYRILHIIHSGAIGGGPQRLYALATHFNQGIWRSSVICSTDGPLATDLHAAGLNVHTINLATPAQNIASFPRLVRTIHTIKPDIIQVYGQYAGFFGGLASQISKSWHVVYRAGFPSFYTNWDIGRTIRNEIAERVSCWCADKIVCISQTDLNEYIRRRLAAPTKLSMIYNGIDIASFDTPFDRHEIRRQCQLPVGAPIIAFFGRLSDQKGVKYLLQAAPSVLKEYPSCHFLIVGDGPERNSLQHLATQLGINSQTTFFGMRRDIPALMNAVDVVAIPSLFEPFGAICSEAMAAGKAIVTSNIGGLGEQIEDQVTGILVEPRSIMQLSAALIKILSNPETAHQLGVNARARVKTNFSLSQMVDNYRRLYLQLLSPDH
jgi:glycosyltransferase involved in cell wall biosynthesis